MEVIKKYRIQILFTLIGIIAGYLYWHFIGCTSGSCPIFSRWHLTMLYGGFLRLFYWRYAKQLFGQKKAKQSALVY
jgi:hypothetical protein